MKMTAGRTLALSICLLSQVTAAFEVDGYRSHMSRQEVERIARQRNSELLWWGDGLNATIGSRRDDRIDYMAVFCNEELVRISRNIDPDLDYLDQVKEHLERHGAPKIRVTNGAWRGPGGGRVQGLDMRWATGSEYVNLSIYPEGRTGAGALRHNRSASLAHGVVSSCLRDLEGFK